jgi:hypothetical protein
MERSAIRDSLSASTLPPDFAPLYPGYKFLAPPSLRYTFAFSRRKAPELFHEPFPQTRGSRECRVLAAPAVSCAMCTRKCAQEHTGTAGARRHSLRNGLTAYAALSLETNSFCLHRCRLDGSSIRSDHIRHRQLGTSHGCQDHTVLPYAATSVILRAVLAHG